MKNSTCRGHGSTTFLHPIPIATQPVLIARLSPRLVFSRCGPRSPKSALIALRRSSANPRKGRAASSSRPLAMQATCRELDILFVVDEIITGFGRTGPMFAAEHEGLMPDLMTLAKGLTAGYAPMGATLVSDRVYDVIADGASDGAPFGHGFTYSGHPVSAAIGLEVMRLYQEDGLLANGQAVGAYFGERLREFIDHPLVGDVRSQGLLAGLELVIDKTANGSRRKTSDLAPGCSTSDIGTVSSFALSRMTRSASLHPYASRQTRSIF